MHVREDVLPVSLVLRLQALCSLPHMHISLQYTEAKLLSKRLHAHIYMDTKLCHKLMHICLDSQPHGMLRVRKVSVRSSLRYSYS